MAWRYTREHHLLRLAPWADVAEVRAEFISELHKVTERRNLKSLKEQLIIYENGGIQILPNIYTVTDVVHYVLGNMYADYQDSDERFGDAINTFIGYFTEGRYWERVEE